MKQILLTCIAFAACCAPVAAQQVKADDIAGKYVGDLYVALGEEEYTDDARVSAVVNVNKSAIDDKVDFSLPNFSFAGMQLGDIFLPNIPISYVESLFHFGENPMVRFNFKLDEESSIVADVNLDNNRSYIKGDSIVAYIPYFLRRKPFPLR